jgi:uncharacterized protein (TIRG00374 family)
MIDEPMRRVMIQLIKIVISGLLIWFLLRRIGMETLWQNLRQVQLFWFFMALFLFTTSHFLGGFQWWRMMRAQTLEISYSKTLSFYFTGLFFNNLLVGGIGGDVCRMMDVRRISCNTTAAVSTVFMDRMAGLLVISGMAVLTSPYLIFRSEIDHSLPMIFLILVSAWILVLCFLFIRRFARPFAWFIRKILPQTLHIRVRDVYNSIYWLGRQRLFIEVLIISFWVQSARIIMHYFLALALGCAVPVVYFFLFVPIIAIIASLPISVGGIGMREQTGVLLFAMAGMAGSDAFTMEFLAFVVAIISGLPGGILFIMRKQNQGTRIKKQEARNENKEKEDR